MVEAIDDGVVTDRATVDRYLSTIGGEVERLAQLIDDLFELSQIDAGAAAPAASSDGSLHDLISDTLRCAQRARPSGAGVALVGRVDADAAARSGSTRPASSGCSTTWSATRCATPPPGGAVELGALERPTRSR